MSNQSLPPWPYPRAIAHRDVGKLAPENTLAALRLGASFGYTAFEFDVKLSGDGKSFLLHDETLDRTTSGCGRADALSFSEKALEAGRQVAPELPRALLVHVLPGDWLERLQRLGCVALDCNHRELTRDVIAVADRISSGR